jgi:hypothetical protein
MCPAFVDICAISCNYNSYSNSIVDEDCWSLWESLTCMFLYING